ncbi:hypothetical protein [Streptomyces lavendofoliae]|uniref:hypothetical protein n=1 Tax=Streptomyces lavendofoliae TaxID=67314 RepID=UPI00300EB587
MSPTPAGNQPAFKPPWIDPKESLHYKEMYRDLSHSVTGLKLDVSGLAASLTGLKTDITVAALGLTLVKADLTLIKMDEKGITIRGKQWATFRWADEKKNLENRIERAEKKTVKRQQELDDEVEKLKRLKGNIDDKRTEAGATRDKAKLYEIRSDLSDLMAEAGRIEKRINTKLAKVSKAGSLQQTLDKIKKDEKTAEETRKKVVEDAERTREELKGLTRQMRSTQESVRNLARHI